MRELTNVLCSTGKRNESDVGSVQKRMYKRWDEREYLREQERIRENTRGRGTNTVHMVQRADYLVARSAPQ